ncbi:MAG TPA: hypothetical protein VGB05_04500 [Pyrinomonadaceae bacterium]|jgi:hypothetical protein
MSDYLWDKTGEPQEDVAQLENLLGALKYQPRPLEIPATAMPATPATARTASIFSRPRLALAASLLLTLLAGAWLVTRQGEPQQNQVVEVKQGSPAAGSEKPDKAAVANVETGKQASVGDVGQTKPREDKAVVVAASARRPQRAARQPVVRRYRSLPRVEKNSPAPHESVAVNGAMRWQAEQPLTPQQREATEQLMFALRLASAKLNYAQREMQEIGRTGK